MKCPNCGGTGKEYWNGNVFCNTGFECDKCNGTGEIEMTNEEWRKTCSAEDFAEWITDKINAKLSMALHDAELYDGDVNENEYMENEDEWVVWLKEKHGESE